MEGLAPGPIPSGAGVCVCFVFPCVPVVGERFGHAPEPSRPICAAEGPPPRFSTGSLHAVAFQAWSLHVLERRGLSRLMICPLAAQSHMHACAWAHQCPRARLSWGGHVAIYRAHRAIYIVYRMEIYRVPYACVCMWVWVTWPPLPPPPGFHKPTTRAHTHRCIYIHTTAP